MAEDTGKPIDTLPAKVDSQDVSAEPVAAPALEAATSEIAAPAPVAAEPAAPAAVKAPAPKAKRGRPRKAVAATPAVAPKPASAPVAAPAAKAPRIAPATARKATRKPAATAPRAKPAKLPAKVAPAKASVAKTAPAKSPASSKAPVTVTRKVRVAPAPQPKSKDKTMASSPIDFTAAFKTAFADFQEKAKTAYAKGTGAFGEANDFAKGNVEAVVESSKILASGLQELGTAMVADSRAAFDSLSSEVKDLAAVKSPTEFLQLQSALLRKHFDAVVAQTSKNTEAVLKLTNDAMSPISTRVTLAVEKVAKAA